VAHLQLVVLAVALPNRAALAHPSKTNRF
jgi:hypothetical protein